MSGLKKSIVVGDLVFVVCGSVWGFVGVSDLFDVIVSVGSLFLDVLFLKVVDWEGNFVEFSVDGNVVLVGLVFKVVYFDMGKVCYVRIF